MLGNRMNVTRSLYGLSPPLPVSSIRSSKKIVVKLAAAIAKPAKLM